MPIASSKHSGSFIPCPAGPQRLVCCDVVDHGIVEGTWAGKPKRQHKITLRFQSEHKMPDGKPFLVGRRFTLSLGLASALRPFLESWRGVAFTESEAEGFELDRLLGVSAYGNVTHKVKPAGTFAEIISIMPMPKGTAKLAVDTSYVLVRNQTHDEPARESSPTREDDDFRTASDDADDPIPF